MNYEEITGHNVSPDEIRHTLDFVAHLGVDCHRSEIQQQLVSRHDIPKYRHRGLTPYQYPYVDVRKFGPSHFEVGEIDSSDNCNWATYTIEGRAVLVEERTFLGFGTDDPVSPPLIEHKEPRELSQEEMNELRYRLVAWPLVPRQKLIDGYKNRRSVRLIGLVRKVLVSFGASDG